jgi:glycosyltransferase involved in cell wall biosynthesis
MPDGSPWPRITVVTPSYNQGQFLEETIRSVLLQGYPDLEYIVLDGGSTDDSVEIIRAYAPYLAYWVSQPDAGQAAAIAKGLALATGEIAAYLNSDDIFYAGVLSHVAQEFGAWPEAMWVTGAARFLDLEISRPKGLFRPSPVRMPQFMFGPSVVQPSTFWRSAAHREVRFDDDYHDILDTVFFSKLAMRYGQPRICNEVLAGNRHHPAMKTARFGDGTTAEYERLARYWERHYTAFGRVRLWHAWRTCLFHYALTRQLDGRMSSADWEWVPQLLRLIATYPPGLLNRYSLGAIRRLLVAQRAVRPHTCRP